jgi:hypothetical protein
VAQVIRLLMAKRPEDRYQTPAELAATLEDLYSGAPRTQRIPKPAGFTSVTQVLRKGSNPFSRTIRRHPFLMLALVVLLAAGLLGWWAMSRTSRIHPVLGYELKKHPADAVHFHGHWYAYYPEKVSFWNDAKRRCQELGGYLACVRSPEEQDFVLKLTNKQNAWLGGYNDDKSKWFWLTGEPITEFYWAPTQPDDGPNVFLQLLPTYRFSKEEKCWADVARHQQQVWSAGFICEWGF